MVDRWTEVNNVSIWSKLLHLGLNLSARRWPHICKSPLLCFPFICLEMCMDFLAPSVHADTEFMPVLPPVFPPPHLPLRGLLLGWSPACHFQDVHPCTCLCKPRISVSVHPERPILLNLGSSKLGFPMLFRVQACSQNSKAVKLSAYLTGAQTGSRGVTDEIHTVFHLRLSSTF